MFSTMKCNVLHIFHGIDFGKLNFENITKSCDWIVSVDLG
jgi:hypothetical protein